MGGGGGGGGRLMFKRLYLHNCEHFHELLTVLLHDSKQKQSRVWRYARLNTSLFFPDGVGGGGGGRGGMWYKTNDHTCVYIHVLVPHTLLVNTCVYTYMYLTCTHTIVHIPDKLVDMNS